jgi:hypothetical protein
MRERYAARRTFESLPPLSLSLAIAHAILQPRKAAGARPVPQWGGRGRRAGPGQARGAGKARFGRNIKLRVSRAHVWQAGDPDPECTPTDIIANVSIAVCMCSTARAGGAEGPGAAPEGLQATGAPGK